VSRSKFAPTIAETANAGSEVDLESRIDERPFTEVRDSFKALRDRLAAAKIAAMLDVTSTKLDADQVFVKPHSAVVVLGAAPWDAEAIRTALGTAASGVWSNSAPATWRAGNVRELEGLGKIAMAADGAWLVIGDSADLVNAIFARRNRPAIAGAAYAAGWRHARELPNFERMTRLIDFPQLPVAATPNDDAPLGGEPPYFSANLASLGRTLRRIDLATIVVHDAGSMLREQVVYRLTP
jgi:hypothetical protein